MKAPTPKLRANDSMEASVDDDRGMCTERVLGMRSDRTPSPVANLGRRDSCLGELHKANH